MSYAPMPSPSLTLPTSLDPQTSQEFRALVTQLQGSAGIVNALITDLNAGWVTTPFLATSFTGSGAMTWTVTQANVTTLAYKVIGSMAWFSFFVSSTTVGGTPSSNLLYQLPNGFKVNGTFAAPLVAYDTGTAVAGALVEAKGNVLKFFKTIAGANWTAGASTHLICQIACQLA